MSNNTLRPLHRRHSRASLMALLMGCSALVAIAPGAQAQEIAIRDASVVLDPVTLDSNGGDNDANSIVAQTITSGSGMATDILDTPASVTVITSKDIEKRGADTAEEVLRYSAGVVTDFWGGDDRFDYFKIRGFDAYQYRDGLTLGKPFGGLREEAFAYERVEVLKGANSTAFGVSDPGGAVNYVTKLPRTERFGEVYLGASSYGNAQIGFDLGDNLTPDSTLSYRLTGKIQRGDAEADHSQADETFLMGGLTWRPSDATSMSFVLDYLDLDGSTGSGHPEDTDFDRSDMFGEPDFDYSGGKRTSATFLLDHDFGGGLSFSGKARYSDEDREFGYVYLSGASGTTANRYLFANDSSTEAFLADASLQYDTQFGSTESRTLAGLQYRDETARGATYWSAVDGIDYLNPVYSDNVSLNGIDPYTGDTRDTTVKSLYLQQELTFADRLIATIGLRRDWMDIEQTPQNSDETTRADFGENTLRFGLTYKITPDLSAYASYAESAVPASLTVEPERGEQYELGVKYRPAGMNALFSAAVYDLKKTNITRTDTTANPPVETTIGEIRARGLELEARAELTKAINLTAAYSYTDTEITDRLSPNQGNSLAKVPAHLASVWMDYTLAGEGARGDMNFGLGARYTGTYYDGDANTGDKTEAALIFDAAYSYQMQQNTELALNVTNLFDEKHDAGGSGAIFYNPGREVSLTLRRSW